MKVPVTHMLYLESTCLPTLREMMFSLIMHIVIYPNRLLSLSLTLTLTLTLTLSLTLSLTLTRTLFQYIRLEESQPLRKQGWHLWGVL